MKASQPANRAASKQGSNGIWQKSSIANLVRYQKTRVYFARVRIGGKLIRKSLKTTVFSIAKHRLNDLIKEERVKVADGQPTMRGPLTFQSCVDIYLKNLDADQDLKPRTKEYRRECLLAIRKTWRGIDQLEVKKITKTACHQWAAAFRKEGTKFKQQGAKKELKGVSPSRFNNTVGTLKQILQVAVEMGGLYNNPAAFIKRARERTKELTLPSKEDFVKFVDLVENSGAGQSKEAATLVRFLAFTGCRISEAVNVKWKDIDWGRNELVVRGNEETATKNWEIRRVPMITELQDMLTQLKKRRGNVRPHEYVLRVKECQKSMDRAARLLGIARITHHDLRHLFATMAIESGIDIPTVSKLLGHKDGGALAMKTYGHLRQEHAQEQVKKIRFGV